MATALLLLALGGCEAQISSNGSEAAAEPAAPEMVSFVNRRENALSEALQRHYVDFSFDYPADWRIARQPPGDQAMNYVNLVAVAPPGERPPFLMNVGHAFGTGNADYDQAEMARALPAIARQFGLDWADYQLTSIGEGRLGRYDSHQWRFAARTRDPAATRVYGRGDVILPVGATRGLIIVSLATEASGIRSAAEVGESGPIKAVHDSLELDTADPAAVEENRAAE